MLTSTVKIEADNQKNGSTSSTSTCNSSLCTIPYREVFYLSLGSQPNIYSSCKLRNIENGQDKIFVASLRGKVSCLECQSESSAVSGVVGEPQCPQSSEIYFTYIPGDAEIISISGFPKVLSLKAHMKCYFIIGITLILIKNTHGEQGSQHFFNVYMYATEETGTTNLDRATQICQHKLNFTPYQLTCARIYDSKNDELQFVFLMSGSDAKIHMFREDKEAQTFDIQPTEKFFPEFNDLPSNATWIDVKDCEDDQRLSSVGCQNGYVKVSVVDIKSGVILKSSSIREDGPISSVQLFQMHSVLPNTDLDSRRHSQNYDPYMKVSSFSLLVTSLLEVAAVFLQVAEFGLSNMIVLPRSDAFDSVTCSLVADVDLDGANEILIGTYGQEMLVYKWHNSSGEFSDTVHFDLLWSRSFSKPLFAIHNLDLLNNGFQELAVVSLAGVHVLQHDVNQLARFVLTGLHVDKDCIDDPSDIENCT